MQRVPGAPTPLGKRRRRGRRPAALFGALTMAAFGLGTLRMMIPLAWSGARMGRWLQRPGFRTGAAVLILFAGLVTFFSPWLMQVPALHAALVALGCAPPH